MKYEEFVQKIWECVVQCPKEWRKGQSVFNVMEEQFGSVAREVQFIDNVDCFYDDSKIDLFLDKCWVRLASKEHPITQRDKED